jgi:DNA repair protein RecO (recombination protein O)
MLEDPGRISASQTP